MVRSLFLAMAAATLSAAHFTLNWPPTAGFDDDKEPNAPCGGATVVVNDTAPEISVDRFAVSLLSSHPAGNWSFRATKNTKAPYDFTEIVPGVVSKGLGSFCLTHLRAPSDWAGSEGVLQVIDYSVDGTLYQCAPVKFVSGSNNTIGSSCSNNTGFSAQWESASTASASGSATGSSSSSSSATSAAASSASSGAAAVVTGVGSMVGLGLLAAGLAW